MAQASPKPQQRPSSPPPPATRQPEPPRNPGPSTSPATAPAPAPAASPAPRSQAPAPGPLPLPEVPRKPRRAGPLPAPAAAPSPGTPAKRPLPADPIEREKALETVRPEAQTLLAMLSALAARLPPQRPLSETEIAMIQGPLEQVLWKYGTEIPCEWMLVGTIGFVALGRYSEVQAAKKKGQPSGEAPK